MPSADVSVRFSVQDADTVKVALERLAADGQAALDRLAAASTAATSTVATQSAALMAANANVAGSVKSADDSYQGFAKSVVDNASGFLTTVGHLKLLAVAAYAMSPAFRSFTTIGVTSALSLLGANAGLVTTAVTRMVSVASPALSFFTRLAAPIGIAVAAFKLFSDTISTGSSLLDKYGNAERKMFGADVDANLEKLTRFQNDTISLQQVQYATELGSRLNDAKQTISDFLKVQLDLTDPALKLQNVWVVIVETLAKGLTLAGQLPDALQRGAQAAGNSSIWNYLPKVSPDQQSAIEARIRNNSGDDQNQISAEQSFDLAKKRLAAGMGGGFVGRFTQDINDLANPPKPPDPPKDTADAWTRFADQQTKANAAVQANIQTVGLAAGAQEQMKVQLQGVSILERDGVIDDEARRAKLAELAKQAGDAAAALAQLQINKSINFDAQTALLSPQDVQIAQQLKTLYPDVTTALNSTEAAAIRVNNTYKSFGDFMNTSSSQITTGLADIVDHTKPIGQGFADMSKVVVRSLEEMLIKLTVVAPLMQSLRSAVSGLGFGSGPTFSGDGSQSSMGGGFGGAAFGSANGNAFSAGNVIPFAVGGIVRRPTLFPMANGGTGLMGEAGDEGVMPLTRINGKLGVYAAGGGSSVPVTININEAPAGTSVKNVKATRTAGGGISIDMALTQKIKSVMSNDLAENGDITQGFSRRFGLDSTRGMA